MFGTQIDDPVTTTTPLKADPVVTGSKIHGFQIDPIQLPDSEAPTLCIHSAGNNRTPLQKQESTDV